MYLVVELISLAGFIGLDGELDVCELAASAGLAHIPGVHRRRAGYGLLVGDLRLADVGLHLELAQQPVNYYFQMELAHTGDYRLARLLIRVGLEGGVLLSQLGEGHGHLLLAGLGLGLDGHADDRLGEFHSLQDDLPLVVGQGVARSRILEAHGRGDVAGIGRLQVLSVVGVHQQYPAEALSLPLGGVHHGLPRVHLAGIHAEEGQLAHVGVSHYLECKC